MCMKYYFAFILKCQQLPLKICGCIDRFKLINAKVECVPPTTLQSNIFI